MISIAGLDLQADLLRFGGSACGFGFWVKGFRGLGFRVFGFGWGFGWLRAS